MTKNSTTVRIIRIAARFTALIFPDLAARWLERLFLSTSRWPTPPRELDWLATAKRSFIRFNDSRKLPLFIWGSGPTILLVHGWSGRGSQMGAFVEPLVAQGFQVVAFDAPSHGEADGKLSGLPEFATAIERVVEQIGPVRAIVAHSVGTAATTVALSRGLSVERAIYVAPPENPGSYLYRTAIFFGFGRRIAHRAQARIEKRFQFRFENARGTTLALSLDVALLVIHDLSDLDVPYQDGVRLVQGWSRAELMTTSGLGHRRVLRAPEVIKRAVEFLTESVESSGIHSIKNRFDQEATSGNRANLPNHQVIRFTRVQRSR